jgi:hypothetical protein
MATPLNNPVPAGFDALSVLDLRNPNFTVESNRLLAELRAKGSLCRVEPLGALGFLRWADCDTILRDFKTFSAAFARKGRPEPTKQMRKTGKAMKHIFTRSNLIGARSDHFHGKNS